MATFTPTPIIIRTALDEHGSLLDIPRIPGEELRDYAKRLFDTYANRASSTYTGLLNGINRELGLDRTDLMTVDIRGIGFGEFADANVTLGTTTIQNTNSYTDTINGTTITAVGDTLTDTTQSWTPGYLRGYILKIQTNEWEVIDNTATTLTVNADMSDLVGEVYTVEVDWEANVLVGLGLEIGNKLYKITENTNDIIRIEIGDLTEGDSTFYKIRAFNPKVEVTSSTINFYKEFSTDSNFQLEKSFELRNDVVFHRDIVTEVNKLKFFEATNLLSSNVDVLAVTLNRQSSENIVIKETVPAAKFFKLQNEKVKEDSVKFVEANIFLREVDEDQVSQAVGNYNVDYDQGIIKVNSTPSGKKTVSYVWNDFPFTITDSAVIINPFNEEDSQEFLFLQEEMTRYSNPQDQFRSTIPKADMIEYIAELLAVKPENWGE
jgi:hypothetical protein